MKRVEEDSRKTDRMKTEAGLHLEKLSKGDKNGLLKEGGNPLVPRPHTVFIACIVTFCIAV